MKAPTGKVVELAEAIVRTDVAPDGTDAEQLAGAERLLGAVQYELIPLIGGTGFHAILDRAFRRVATERGFTGYPREPRPTSNAVRDLRDDLGGLPAHDIHGATLAIIAELISLLSRLIGADLTARMVHRTWPDAAPWLKAAHLENGDG